MRAKAHRLTTQKTERVDASDYGPEENLEANVQTGARPVSRRAYKRGGKVGGEDAKKHAGKTPRKASGGAMTANSFANVNMKDANAERKGARKADDGAFKRGGRADGGEVPTTLLNIGGGQSMARKAAGLKRGGKAFEGTPKDVREDKHLAKKHGMSMKEWEASDMDKKHDKQRNEKGLKSGGGASGKWIQSAIKHPGALHKELGVPEGKKIPEKKLEKATHSDNPKLAKRAHLAETLGRMHRKDGGRAKGKTDINIIISAGPRGQQPGMPDTSGMPAGAPVPVGPPALGATGPAIPGAPPAVGAPPPMGPAGAPPMPMPRKRGGRAMSYKDMTAGAGSGEGRLQKTDIAKHKK